MGEGSRRDETGWVMGLPLTWSGIGGDGKCGRFVAIVDFRRRAEEEEEEKVWDDGVTSVYRWKSRLQRWYRRRFRDWHWNAGIFRGR